MPVAPGTEANECADDGTETSQRDNEGNTAVGDTTAEDTLVTLGPGQRFDELPLIKGRQPAHSDRHFDPEIDPAEHRQAEFPYVKALECDKETNAEEFGIDRESSEESTL